jgi:ubiquinone/menaquinone biosynthesis C-methylase UbiE
MKTVVDQFNKRADTYSASANWIFDSPLIQAHIEAAGRKSSGHLLELCCGTGMVGRNFQAVGWSVCGIDLTRGMAEEANRYFPCICCSAEQIPFLDGSFDVVVLRQAYFLLDDGQKVLSEARRVLKDDGVLVFSQTVPFSKDDTAWLEHIHRSKQAQLREFYTAESLANELEKACFEIAETRRLAVRENITRWMAAAPELSVEKQAEICRLVADAPEPYRTIHKVSVSKNEILEDWNWVIYTARKQSM